MCRWPDKDGTWGTFGHRVGVHGRQTRCGNGQAEGRLYRVTFLQIIASDRTGLGHHATKLEYWTILCKLPFPLPIRLYWYVQ
jgi:hypothetical protein